MFFFILILLFIIFNEIKFASKDTFFADYLSKEKTNAIKGIFVILIIFNHSSQYIQLDGNWDMPYVVLKEHLNQMVVAMFLFYSGYGIVCSIKKKQFEYVRGILRNRLFPVFGNFAIAVMLFLVANLFLGNYYDFKTIMLSFIGWKSIGNSNWYMFVIFVLYILTFLSYYCIRWIEIKKGIIIGTVLLTVLSIIFVFWEMKMGQPNWFYNTVILFSLGSWYALVREKVEKIAMCNDLVYFLIFAICVGLYLISFRNRWAFGIEGYTIWAIAFTVMVILITMKVSIFNPILTWFGTHVFSVYILQRLPMMILSHFGVSISHKYIFVIVVFTCTIPLALIFDGMTGLLWKKWKR